MIKCQMDCIFDLCSAIWVTTSQSLPESSTTCTFSLSLLKIFILGEGNGNPLQYTCLGKSHGQRNLAGHSPWGQKKKKKKKYSSYFWLHRVLAVARGNLIAPRRLLSSCGTGAQELPHTGLVAVGGMWDLSSPHFSSF